MGSCPHAHCIALLCCIHAHGAHCTTRTPPAGAPPAPATEARAPALPSALARAGDAPARRD